MLAFNESSESQGWTRRLTCLPWNPIDYIGATLAYLGVFLAATWLVLSVTAKCLEVPVDPQEPPVVKSRLPLLGHIWGLYKHGPKYYQRTSLRAGNALIHTLNVLTGKIYVITSPSIVNQVSKNSKTISFNPLITEVGIRLTNVPQQTRTILERNIDGSQGKDSYVIEVHDQQLAALAPGPEASRITQEVLQTAWKQFLQPLEGAPRPAKIPFYAFLRHMLATASTLAIYGPENPVTADPSVEEAFWTYNRNVDLLLLDKYPAITARAGHKARSHIAKAFKKYFDSDPVGCSSQVAEARYLVAKKHGLSTTDMGRLEVGTMIAILVNTVPALFYLLFHVYSDAELLAAIRKELDQHVMTESGDKAKLTIASLRTHCPLFNSTLQEVLRNYSESASARVVCEDTMISNYTLKKGTLLQMPNSVIHRDTSVWKDVNFNARRFLKPDQKQGQNESESAATTSAASYRPFGGGSTLCPGRHFASMEILGLAALWIGRFDVTPVAGVWRLPVPKQNSAVEGLFPPAGETDVFIRKREGTGEIHDVTFE